MNKSIFEIKHRLGVCNATIFTISELFETQNDELNLVVESSGVTLKRHGNLLLSVKWNPNIFQAKPTSCGHLEAGKHWIKFRVDIDVDACAAHCATFETELMNNSVRLKASTEYSVLCRNCSACLAANINFARILPALSVGLASDQNWFCCGSEHANEERTLASDVQDCLEGPSFYQLSLGNLSVIKDGASVRCRRCVGIIGLNLDGEEIQLWNSLVCWDNGVNASFSPELDFALALHHMTQQNSNVGCKLIITSTQGTAMLFVWILDKNVSLFVATVESLGTSVELAPAKAMSVLFSMEVVGRETALTKQWQSNSNVARAVFPNNIFSSGVAALKTNAAAIPQQKNANGGFTVSRLFL